jgi:hypothetical protein
MIGYKTSQVIFAIVLTCHLLFFFFPLHKQYSPPLPKKSIMVNTYVPRPKAAEKRPAPTTVKKRESKPAPRQKILSDLKKTLTKIETRHDKMETKGPLFVPKSIEVLAINAPDDEKRPDDLEFIVATLKDRLILPEQGRVTLQLSLFSSGRVKEMRIFSSESENNQRYLERTLPNIDFPLFEKDLSLTFTFCNDQ